MAGLQFPRGYPDDAPLKVINLKYKQHRQLLPFVKKVIDDSPPKIDERREINKLQLDQRKQLTALYTKENHSLLCRIATKLATGGNVDHINYDYNPKIPKIRGAIPQKQLALENMLMYTRVMNATSKYTKAPLLLDWKDGITKFIRQRRYPINYKIPPCPIHDSIWKRYVPAGERFSALLIAHGNPPVYPSVKKPLTTS